MPQCDGAARQPDRGGVLPLVAERGRVLLSAYLVDAADTRVLIDCGNGAFSRLREVTDYASIDAIAITHTHGDHMLDLLPFAYALLYSPRALEVGLRKPTLLLPPGARERIRQIFG